MTTNPFSITESFEKAVAQYTGAPYAVAVDSCTNAIFLACKLLKVDEVRMPTDSYISPCMSVVHAGGKIIFDKRLNNWKGIYKLEPYPIYDAAKRFTSNMYIKGTIMCLSFHVQKHLKLGKGGMLLLHNKAQVDWLKKARYEGRTPDARLSEDAIDFMGWNMYLNHQLAALGLSLMQNIQEHNEDLPNHYRDLTTFPVFNKVEVIEDNDLEL